jgi:hypothetical protein
MVVASAAIASGKSLADAATLAGVDPSTVRRWCKRPDFRRSVRRQLDAVVLLITGELTDAMLDAVRKMRALMSVGIPAVELRAACSLLDLGSRHRAELTNADLDERLAKLEGTHDPK